MAKKPLIVGVLGVGLLVCGASISAPANASTPDGLDYATQEVPNFVAAQVAEVLTKSLENTEGFVGVEVVQAGVQVDWSGRTPTDLQSLANTARSSVIPRLLTHGVQLSPLDVPVSVTQKARSIATLNSLSDTIQKDQKYWESQGLFLSSWGPDLASDTVEVTLSNTPSTDLTDQFLTRYGAGVSIEGVKHTVISSGRSDDAPAWTGGDGILLSGKVGTCTSWFKLKNSDGKQYSATAAHCGKGIDDDVTSVDGFTHFGSVRKYF